MCNCIQQNNICSITLKNCPFMYYCNKYRKWKPLNSMPINCKIKEENKIPKGHYKVRMERKEYLYIDIENQTYKLLNPFDYIPLYVKVVKNKDGTFKIKK